CRTVPQISAVMLTLSVVSCLFIPAQSITVRTIVPRGSLLRANAALSQAFYLIRIASPLIARAIVARFGEKTTFIMAAASFLISALLISTLIVHRERREDADRTMAGLGRDFVEGNRFIF